MSHPTPSTELNRWLEKYEPVAREIILAREKRFANAQKRRARRARQFGDLCEATEGLAVVWQRENTPVAEMLAWADGDVLTLKALMPFLRHNATARIDALRRKLTRPLYYERENERRRRLAAERRRVRRRHTENPCPTREEVLEAWTHVRDGREAMLRFGSLLEDLECYVDHELRIVDGRVIGRAPGIKGWLREHIPALALRYSTVMRYKAAAKKLRQIVELRDPVPVAAILDAPVKQDYDAEEYFQTMRQDVKTKVLDAACTGCGGLEGDDGAAREVMILRARAVYLEAMAGIDGGLTRAIERIDALLDPARVAEATMLKSWRDRYAAAITPRSRQRWLRRLFARVCLFKRTTVGAGTGTLRACW